MYTLEDQYRDAIRSRKTWMKQKGRAVNAILGEVRERLERGERADTLNGDVINFAAEQDYRLKLSDNISTGLNELRLEWIAWVSDEVREAMGWETP